MHLRNVAAVVAAPVTQGILNYIGKLKLEPLAHWGTTQSTLAPVTYIISASFAVLACLCKAQTNRAKSLLVIFGLLLLLISLVTYTWVSSTPPRSDLAWLFDTLGVASFILTYGAFGFVVARVVKFFGKI